MVDRVAKFIEHRQSFGYLDAGTESLANTASATVPHPTRPITHERPPPGERTAPGVPRRS